MLKPKKQNPYFLESYIHSPNCQKELWKRTLHVAFPKKINKNEINNVQISLPTLPEQTAIGNFFRTLDDLIDKQKRKADALK
ncbi:restriction endonuclease subunit S, partial [Oscillospiraceae bacterium OttesenSCG-928-F05]|nr:restriction endonuclease subunit S [Oscillospiraceae bacterium OttesenSCG-928-F05]